MAIVNRLNQNEVVQQTTQTQNNNGVAEVKEQNTKPIDFTTDKTTQESKKNIEILDFLNSEEFKNLSEEEQLKVFKEKYGLGLSDKELSETLKNAKKVAAEFEQRTMIASGEDIQTKNAASSNDATKAEITAKQDIIETLKQRGIEKPTQGDVYDYLVKLQESGVELTAEQSKMLKTFNTLLDNGFQGLKPTKHESNINKTESNNKKSLLSVEEVLSKEYLSKTPIEKLNTYMDAYLTANDPEYAKLSDREKNKYCNKRSKELLNNFTKELDFDKDRTIMYANAILDDFHRKGEKISDFSDPSLAKKSDIAFSNEIKAGINNIFNRAEFKDKTPTEQLKAFGDILFSSDNKYLKLSDAEKMEYIKTTLQDKLDDMGYPVSLDTKDPKKLHNALTCFTSILQDFAKQPEEVTLQKYMQDLSKPEIATAKFLSLIPDTEENKELLDELYTKMDIITALQKAGINEPTLKDMYTYLKSKKELSPTESKLLKRFEGLDEMGVLKKDKKMIDRSLVIINNKIKAGKSTEEIVKTGIRRFGNNKDKLINYMNTLVELRPEDYEKIMNELKKEYSQEQMKEYFGELHAHALVEGMIGDNANLVDKTMNVNPNSNYNDKAYRISNKLMSKNENSKLIAKSMDNDILKQKSSEALNDRQYYTKNDALEIFETIGNQKLTSNSNLSQFTELYMEKNAINGSEEQLFFADKLTSIGNSAITEGVAAASDSIDSNYRSQYNKIIENAISSGNYSSSDANKIRNALKSGNISQETLADKSIPEKGADNSNAKVSNADNANRAAEAKQPAQTQQPTNATVPTQPAATASATASTQNQQTISQIINDNISTPSTTSSATVSNSTKTSTTSSTSRTQETSSAKKADAMSNAADTKTNIDNSIKDWEKTHNQTLSSNDIESLKTAVSSGVIDDVLEDPTATSEAKAFVRNLVANATSINDLYTKLVSIYGSKVQNKFVDILATNGSAAAIHNFAENNGSKEIIKDLYIKCGSSTLKSELLNLLPPTTVSEMLAAHQITDLSSVDYKVLKEYVLKNISSMSNSDFNHYLKYLPLDERQALVKARFAQTQYTGSEGGEIGMYADKLGFNTTTNTQTVNQTPNQPTEASNNKTPSNERNEQFYDDGLEPFYDTIDETQLDEFTNNSNSKIQPGSDEWESNIRRMQAGVKVPPSSVYATYTPEDNDIDWEIGSAGATKLPFGRDYDKQKRGTIYWG